MAKILERLVYQVDGDIRGMKIELSKAEGVARRSGKAMEQSFDGLERRVKATELALGAFRGAMIAAAGIAAAGAVIKSQLNVADAIDAGQYAGGLRGLADKTGEPARAG